jgi:predicted outer membrane protein
MLTNHVAALFFTIGAAISASGAHAAQEADAIQLTDGEIAYIYLHYNQFDVEEAELGVARGTAPEVKQHGEMVANDHRGVIKTFEAILAKDGIEPVAPADFDAALKQHQAIMAKLKDKSGVAFDRDYFTYAIINHRAFIDLVRERLLPAVTNPELESHFESTLPAFTQHLYLTVAAAKKAQHL